MVLLTLQDAETFSFIRGQSKIYERKYLHNKLKLFYDFFLVRISFFTSILVENLE